MIDRLDWTPLPRDTAEEILARAVFDGDSTPAEALGLDASSADLPFYAAVDLVRIRMTIPEHSGTIEVFLLRGKQNLYYLDGTSPPIHACNEAEGIDVDEETAPNYLRFFCFAVRGDGGPFRVVEELAEVPDDPELEPVVAAIEAVLQPIQDQGRDEEGRYRFESLMEYQSGLFRAEFSVREDGFVLMEDDEALMADLPEEPFKPLPPLRPAAAIAALVWTGISRRNPGENTFSVMVRLLLERALASGPESRLLTHFNDRFSKSSSLEGFAHMLGTAWPVVAIESSLPFVEKTVVELLSDLLPDPNIRRFTGSASPADDSVLGVSVPDAGPAIGVIPYHVYRSISDVERVAHEIGSREISCLIGCERVEDLPPGLREVLDLTLRFPRLDPELFEVLFRRMTGDEPPDDWTEGGTNWLNHVHHADFQHPVGLGLSPEETVEHVRERSEARLRDVEPMAGLELSELHGLGEARIFAEDLITDIHEALAGRLDWMHVDRGMLLVGAPGTGKTTLARAIAKECRVRFIDASASGWQATGSHLGNHIRAIRSDFARARRFAPSILFIDELDSIGSRQALSGSNRQYHVEVVNALLEQIQGMDPEAPVIVIGATNFEENVDPALKRAGRLDRVVRIPRPNVMALTKIYEHYLEEYVGEDRADDVDPGTLGGLSLGLTGADVELYVRGALRRARREARDVEQRDLIAEITRKPRDPSTVRRLEPEDVERIAVHEAGHALASCLDNSLEEEISFVSIVPRSDGSLGFVARLPNDSVFFTRQQYLERLEVYLAGRAAEELVFGTDQLTSGSGGPSENSDLAVATLAAVQMVTQYGLGPGGSLVWSARPDGEQREEAGRLLSEAYARIKDKLEAHRDSLDAIAAELEERQEMTGEEVWELVREAQ